MLQLTTLTIKRGVYRAYYSDGTSLIISQSDAKRLSDVYNIRIEAEELSDAILSRMSDLD